MKNKIWRSVLTIVTALFIIQATVACPGKKEESWLPLILLAYLTQAPLPVNPPVDNATGITAALEKLGIEKGAYDTLKDKFGNEMPTPHTDTEPYIAESANAASLSRLFKISKSMINAVTRAVGDATMVAFHPLGKDHTLYWPEKEIFALMPLDNRALAGGIYENNNKNNEWSNWASLRDTKLSEIGNLDATDVKTSFINDTVKSGAAGDYDGDGYEEAAVVYLDKTTGGVILKVYDDKSGEYKETTYTTAGTTAYFKTWDFDDANPPGHVDVSAGDIDGDGRDELIIALSVRAYNKMPDNYAAGDPNLWEESANGGQAKIVILDDMASGFSKLTEYTFVGSNARAIYVASGNADTDGLHKAEIAASVSVDDQAKGYVFRYDNSETTPKLVLTMAEPIDIKEGTNSALLADVTFGDFNRDGYPEFTFAGVEKVLPYGVSVDSKYVVLSVQFNGDTVSPSFIKTGTTLVWTDYTSGDWIPSNSTAGSTCVNTSTCDYIKILDVFAETLDLNGDSYPELLINNKVFEWDTTNGLVQMKDASNNPVEIPGMMNNGNSQARHDWGGGIPVSPFLAFHRSNTWITVGDFDGDRRDEILYWGRNDGWVAWLHDHFDEPNTISGEQALKIYGLNTSNNFVRLGNRSLSRKDPNNPAGNYPVLFAINADDDAAIVNFMGSEVIYTEPHPIAAIAASPCFDADTYTDAGQNLEECHSSFTLTDGNAYGTSEGGAFHLEVAAGGQFDAGIKQKIMGHFKLDYEGMTGIMDSFTQSKTFETGLNEDAVVFTAYPFDVYYYEVESVGSIPLTINNEVIEPGTMLRITVPRQNRTYLKSLSIYNEAVALIDASRKIGPDIFSHTPGEPFSYPTKTEMAAFENKTDFLRTTDDYVVTVPNSSGVSSVAFESMSELIKTTSLEVGGSVSYEGETGDVGFVYSIEVGGGYRFDTEEVTSSGFSVDSSIGGISNTAFFDQNNYSVGAFTYQTTIGAMNTRVVNFWVEKK
jgi:hypothetical protein